MNVQRMYNNVKTADYKAGANIAYGMTKGAILGKEKTAFTHPEFQEILRKEWYPARQRAEKIIAEEVALYDKGRSKDAEHKHMEIFSAHREYNRISKKLGRKHLQLTGGDPKKADEKNFGREIGRQAAQFHGLIKVDRLGQMLKNDRVQHLMKGDVKFALQPKRKWKPEKIHPADRAPDYDHKPKGRDY